MDNIHNSEIGNKKCSYCGEAIRADSRRCPYCGSLLEIKVDEFRIEPHEVTTTYIQNGTVEGESVQSFASAMEDSSSDSSEPAAEQGPNMSQAPVYENKQNDTRVYPGNMSYVKSVEVPVNKPLSNGMKVFLTTLCTVVPGLGQLIGIILSIVFMNTDDDQDRKSFGVALLIASLVMFVFSCVYSLVLIMALGAAKT